MPEANPTSTPDAIAIGIGIRPMPPSSVEAVPESDGPLVERIGKLPRDVGWMLFGVGFAGFVAPGIFGLPFMAAGGMILWPKTTRRLQGLLGKKAPEKSIATGMKQIERFLDDLERRYPKANRP
jgi:hypothetical protein